MIPRAPLHPVLCWLLCAASLRAAAQDGGDGYAHHEAAAEAHSPPSPDPSADERASLLRIGDAKLAAGDTESALIAYRQVATSSDDADETARALLGMARTYRRAGDAVKSAATYERLLKDHPGHVETPSALLELGRVLRDLGGTQLALARFYSVLHSTLKLPEAEAANYRRIVRTAQYEIAETHMLAGRHAEAARFFERLDLLGLAPADRDHARFQVARARLLSGDRAGAASALESFIARSPDAEDGPEARFLLATLLDEMGRPADSIQVTIALLQHAQASGETAPGSWLAWQRRAGNQLANRLHAQGDIASALQIYQALAALDSAPVWRLPVLHQIGLCQERLGQTAAALATYRQIGECAAKLEGADDALSEIVRMSAWRVAQLEWWTSARERMQALGPVPPPSPPRETAPAATDTPAPAAL